MSQAAGHPTRNGTKRRMMTPMNYSRHRLDLRLMPLALAVFGVIWGGCGTTLTDRSGGSEQGLEAKIDTVVSAYEAAYGFSGVVLVMLGDSLAYQGARGPADRNLGVPNSPSLRYPINSISKTFLAAAALVLVADRKLDLDEPISTYLPDLPAAWAGRVTAHHLLSHTSGLPREFEVHPWEAPSLADQARRVADLQLESDPGFRYAYSNAGMALLGYLVECVSEMPYPAFLRDRVLKPAGLEDTDLSIGRRVVEGLVSTYKLGLNGVESTPPGKHLGVNPAGGLYSTVGDLYRWVRSLEDQSVLPDTIDSLLFEPQIEETGPNDLAGYAWSLKRIGNTVYRMAAGSGEGSKSAIVREPNRGLFIAVLANWANVPVLDMMRDILFVTEGMSYELPKAADLVVAESWTDLLGTYDFTGQPLSTALGIESRFVTFRQSSGRVYLVAPGTSAELLRVMGDRTLGLTYTDELQITFERGTNGAAVMVLKLNGLTLRGTRVTGRNNG